MMDNIISTVKQKLGINEIFKKAEKGTRSMVYLSDNFVIKINQDSAILKNEGEVLKSLNLDMSPKFVAFYEIENHGVLVEKMLAGQAIDEVWKDIDTARKDVIVASIVDAINKINQLKNDYFWSAQFQVKFVDYADLLLHKFKVNQESILKSRLSHIQFLKIAGNIKEGKIKRIFLKVQPTLLHGDLIMHNILTDSKNLSGILDWEFAQYGDPFYDLARVMYYQECAKAYVDENRDEHFEYDFTSRLIKQLSQNIEMSFEKYKIIRSLFFIDTIIWALNSTEPEKNLAELQPPKF